MFISIGLCCKCLTKDAANCRIDTNAADSILMHGMFAYVSSSVFGPLLTVLRTQKAQVEAGRLFLGLSAFLRQKFG
jgi:hypothetical protein